jgi:hypothetical protein
MVRYGTISDVVPASSWVTGQSWHGSLGSPFDERGIQTPSFF